MNVSTATTDRPNVGSLVLVRGQQWVVSEIDPGERYTVVGLQSVGSLTETLEVIWEIEPGRRVLPAGSLPDVAEGRFDTPDRLAAFLDAVRWSAVTSADVRTLQSPFRSGVAVEDYQLEPVARAVDAPRVNLLLADDVGLGKTIEAGLVAQELLLRQRARRIMVVCPAGLTAKWRDEMAEKFGLDFTVIDSECCAMVRREFGSSANPFHVYPLAIVSLPWLRMAKAQRLLDEVLVTDDVLTPVRTFDLLILDEAHHVAPAAPKQVYAVDSQQTKLIRRLAPHFTHRLFLSATPHNGYPASFTALLEILDDQRFARGVAPERDAVRDTVVRRLKRDIVDADGTPRFRPRRSDAISVEYPESEREIHALLTQFAELRRKKLVSARGRKATDLVTLLLKKRLFSSPAAFGHTVGVYQETLRSRRGVLDEPRATVPAWMDEYLDDLGGFDDEQLADAEDDLFARTRSMQPDADDDETALLSRMADWADTHEARPDAKARELIKYLTSVCRPDKDWLNERVVVFTEYRDTQRWLSALLRQEGLGGPALAELHGGMSPDEREQLRLAFQKEPTEHPVRILLATDAASEGIDLQNYCHRLVNYDIPFNPNKLEQRIGRIDRYGQDQEPEIQHFVGTGWNRAVDAYEADLEFLSRIAKKVAQMEEDLGKVNAVLSDAVQRRMLGDHSVPDIEHAGSGAELVPTETRVGEQVRRLRASLDETVQTLGITPARVKRVVATALSLARQLPLTPYLDERHLAEGLYTVPTLTGSWSRAAVGLTERFLRPGQLPRQLPVTFDPSVAGGRDDVVLAHLNSPLVSMSTRLLRAAVTSDDLHRVTAVVSDDPGLEDVLVGAYSRFVLVGADGVRLHEEVLHAGGWISGQGRFRRLENLAMLAGHLDRALGSGSVASAPVQARLEQWWPSVREGVLASIDWRARTRQASLETKLDQRRESEQSRVVANLAQFEASLRRALDEGDDEDALFSRVEARRPDEVAQYRRDREGWAARIAGLPAERERELTVIAERYRGPRAHRFPVAVVFVVPRREATR